MRREIHLLVAMQHILFTLSEGNPPVGDYSPELSAEQFLFRPGASRACGTIVIYRDNAFEFDEDFAGEVTGLRLAGGAIINSIPGVTITPTRTEVLIIDNNGKI
jgi:hypothetical protein